jgi:tetratricopeptide (TPR) repeat protein
MRHRRFNRGRERQARLVLAGLWLLVLLILVGCAQLGQFNQKPPPEEINVGASFLKQNQRERAVGQFEAAIKAQPTNPDTYIMIGQYAKELGHADLAARYAEQGLGALPNMSAMQRIILDTIASEAYLERGDSARALKFAEEAYQFAPDHIHAMNLLGYTLAEVYEVDDPKQPDARTKLARALVLTNKAVARARDEHETDGRLGMIVDSVGWVHYKLHNYDEAVGHLSRAADLCPRERAIHLHLALALQKKQRYADAITELRRAIQVSPQRYPEAEAALASLRQLLPPGSAPGQSEPQRQPGGAAAPSSAPPTNLPST